MNPGDIIVPMMETRGTIARVYKKTRLSQQGTDFAYWQTQPYEKRLEALETLRREYHLWKYGTEPGFQRVYTIVKRQ